MELLALVLIAYTAVMLLIHVTSWKLLKQWNGPGDSWAGRWLSAQVVLRVEALYWLLVLASWPFWPSTGWKTVVVIFALIHVAAWIAGELRAIRSGAVSALPPRAHRVIVAFDLVEASALVAIAWFVVAFISRY
jgi:hypothetical protein